MGLKTGNIRQFEITSVTNPGAGTTQSPEFFGPLAGQALFVLDITAVGTVTLDVTIQGYDDYSAKWTTIAAFPQKSATGTDTLLIGSPSHDISLSAARRSSQPPMARMRANLVVAGASPTITYKLSGHAYEGYS